MLRQPTSGFLRIPFVQRCELGVAEGRVEGLTCNLSQLGLYVHLASPPAVGATVALRFLLPDGGTPVAATAAVTWSNQDPPAGVADLPVGCGLRFLEMAPADRERIAALVAQFRRRPVPAVGVHQPQSGRLRIPLVAQCALITPRGSERATVCNLSVAGVYVATRAELAVDERVIVSLELPGRPRTFARRARVAWANPDHPSGPHALPPGYGFELLDLSENDRSRLAAAVVEYLALLPEPSD